MRFKEKPASRRPPLTLPALAACLAEAGFALDGQPLERLRGYLALLMRWNRAMNLVGPGDWREVVERLALDSFHLARLLQGLPWPEGLQVWDLGAGAGIPGLPLRMLWTQGEYHLVEAREKRALFLRAALAHLPLPGVRLHHCRAEAFMERASPAHLLLSRAFLPWEKLLALAAGRLAPGGITLIMTRAALPELPEDLAARWQAHSRHPYPGRDGPAFFHLFQARDG